ncbi:MAG TPA: recombinase family protein [Thermoplasmata archaeon]|nr:recombinase family protein [Thermoplasmata archaeon]
MADGESRTAIYARVSTDRQETENQLRELREFCSKRGYAIVRECVDEDVSGKVARKPQLEDLLKAAHRRDFDLVVFWSLDRLTRRGADDAADVLSRIAATGCVFVSYTEPALNTLGPWARIVVDLLAIVANLEAKRISDRTKAGLATARARGTRSGRPIGRPRVVYPVTRDKIAALRAKGLSWSDIAESTGVPSTSARRLATNVPVETRGGPHGNRPSRDGSQPTGSGKAVKRGADDA